MAWWPGKNIGRPQGGWIKQGLARNAELKQRGMDTPQPVYDPAAKAAFGQQGQTGMANQQQAYGLYADMAAGKGPSVAEGQLRAGQDQALANTMAVAAGGRSGNLGAQARTATQAIAGTAMATNAQAAQLRAQEQQAAMAGMAGIAGQQAGQGLGLQGQAAGQEFAGATQWGLGQRGLDIEQLQGNRAFFSDMSKNAANAIGMGVALSDKRAKTRKSASGDGMASDAARHVEAMPFEFKPGMGEPGPQYGVTAQSLARSPAGRTAVMQGPDGLLRVDPKKLASLSMAAAAENTRQIDELKKKISGKKKKKKVA